MEDQAFAIPDQSLPEIAKYSQRPVLRTAGISNRVCQSQLGFTGKDFRQNATVAAFTRATEGQFMYNTIRQRQISSDKIEQISNRISHLKRQEQSIKRNYKMHKEHVKKIENSLAEY